MYSKLIELAGETGREWYSRAEDELRTVADLNGWDPVNLAGVIATTSPKVSVKRNIRIAFEVMGNSNYLDAMDNVIIATEHYILTGEIRGRKTSAFQQALLGNGRAIVLDSWMGKIFKVPQEKLFRADNYGRITRAIKRLARVHGLTYAQTQACLWVGYQVKLERAVGFFPIMHEYRNWQAYGYRFPLGPIADRTGSLVS